MDLLIDVDDVKTRLGLGDSLDVTDGMQSAILGAQLHVATMLETPLDLVLDQMDVFFLSSNVLNGMRPYGTLRLRMKRGFITADTAFSISTGTAWNTAVADRTLLTEGVNGGDYAVDREKGIVLMDLKHEGKYAFVTYSAGFQAGDDLPDWMFEATIGYSAIIFNLAPVNTLVNGPSPVLINADHAESVLAPHIRPRGLYLRPML